MPRLARPGAKQSGDRVALAVGAEHERQVPGLREVLLVGLHIPRREVDGERRVAVVPPDEVAAHPAQLLLDPVPQAGYDDLGLVTVDGLIEADGGIHHGVAHPRRRALEEVAHDTVEAIMGGMLVQVALRPDMAPKLIIGGMPRDQRPRLFALLALTAGLVVIALIQLRREHELSRLRADFVSGVSHELRTPLAQIRMFSETLLLGRVRSDDERVRSLEIIDQEARRLTHLVENLLHFSRSERRLTRLAPAPAPLARLVSEAAEAFAPLAAARGVFLRTALADGIVAPVDADALRQMLLNLLDNAVKYGPPGHTVTLGLAVADRRARISVDDQGSGVPAADRERVWDRFWRLERDRGSAVAGTGIGLSVVRELVALHGGRAWVEDAPASDSRGRGCRFVIELPLEPLGHAATDTGPLHADAGAPA